jgi:predicted phage terminase large subunit-like protein
MAAIVAARIRAGGARVIVNMPPRHGKSRLFAVETPLWWMSQRPNTEVICASYALDLAARHSREARDRFDNERFQLLTGMSVRPDANQVDDWRTNSGSSYKAVGVGGSLTGHGADLLILDDLHNDAAEASSQLMRDRTWDWLLSVAMTRLSPGASVILIGTRWHQDDVTGRLLRDHAGQWEVINLPAFSGQRDLFRRPGEVLWPERFGEATLRRIQAGFSRYFWAALYDGNPIAQGGNYVEVEKFKVRNIGELPRDARRFRFWDLATSSKEAADYTAGALCAMERTGEFWVLDVVRGQWEWPKARARIQQQAQIDRCEVGIEAVGGFKAVFANLIEGWPAGIYVNAFDAERDKLTRALPWFTRTNLGKVNLARGAWNSDFLSECSAFPTGQHDDQVDAVSGAFGRLNIGKFAAETFKIERKSRMGTLV